MANITVLGRLTKDPEVRYNDKGMAIVKFALPVKDRDSTGFLNCVMFGKRAETLGEHFSKGKPILVEGRLVPNNWQDKEGQMRKDWQIKVNNFEFCPRDGTEEGHSGPQVSRSKPNLELDPESARNETQEDDVPF